MLEKIQISLKDCSPAAGAISLAAREAEGLMSRHREVLRCHVIMDGTREVADAPAAPKGWLARIVLLLPDCTLLAKQKVTDDADPLAIAQFLGWAFEKAESLLDSYEERGYFPRSGMRPLHNF